MSAEPQIPELEKRFLEPKGWRWHHFKRDGRKMRFGSVFPDKIPDAVVVCLPGLSEFCEKYFEIAHDMLAQNYAFWVFDWMGQGRSDRYLPDRQKRHSKGFDRDVEDLQAFILGYIKHSAVHPDRGRIPLAMLAHSMGSNIGLHYLKKYPDMFECAAFTAPMLSIKEFEAKPRHVRMLLGDLRTLMGSSYIPGGHAWSEKERFNAGKDKFSSDAARGAVHNAWCLADPELQVGDVTYSWLYYAVKACKQLNNHKTLNSIQTHCLFATAGRDEFVNNEVAIKAADILPNARHIDFPEAQHEILMEKDEIRDKFLEAFHQIVKETIIDRPETLKPF